MRIDFIVCPEHIEEKLRAKHSVTCREACQVLLSGPRIRFAEKGHTEGEDVYAAFGQIGWQVSGGFLYLQANNQNGDDHQCA
jgi:hypothetical protein